MFTYLPKSNDGYIKITVPAIKLGLKGNDLLVYSIIAGYCYNNDTGFDGSIQYLQDWTNADRSTIVRVLANLVKKGLVYKKKYVKNNVLRYRYQVYLKDITQSKPAGGAL